MIGPVAYLIYQEPTLVSQFATFTGHEGFAPVDGSDYAWCGYMLIPHHANR